jgi:hypothetical protein
MADNYLTNSASGGATFASDEETGTPNVQWPYTKAAWGADNAFNRTAVAAPLPVQASIESGQMTVGGVVVTPKFAPIAVSSSGATAIATPGSGKKIRVLSVAFMANGSVNAKFQNGSTDVTGLFYLIANTGASLPFNPAGWFETSATTALNINLSAAIAVGGCITYIEV